MDGMDESISMDIYDDQPVSPRPASALPASPRSMKEDFVWIWIDEGFAAYVTEVNHNDGSTKTRADAGRDAIRAALKNSKASTSVGIVVCDFQDGRLIANSFTKTLKEISWSLASDEHMEQLRRTIGSGLPMRILPAAVPPPVIPIDSKKKRRFPGSAHTDSNDSVLRADNKYVKTTVDFSRQPPSTTSAPSSAAPSSAAPPNPTHFSTKDSKTSSKPSSNSHSSMTPSEQVKSTKETSKPKSEGNENRIIRAATEALCQHIRSKHPKNLSITGAEMSKFYHEYPQYMSVVKNLGLPGLCADKNSGGLLQWVIDKSLAGQGKIVIAADSSKPSLPPASVGIETGATKSIRDIVDNYSRQNSRQDKDLTAQRSPAKLLDTINRLIKTSSRFEKVPATEHNDKLQTQPVAEPEPIHSNPLYREDEELLAAEIEFLRKIDEKEREEERMREEKRVESLRQEMEQLERERERERERLERERLEREKVEREKMKKLRELESIEKERIEKERESARLERERLEKMKELDRIEKQKERMEREKERFQKELEREKAEKLERERDRERERLERERERDRERERLSGLAEQKYVGGLRDAIAYVPPTKAQYAVTPGAKDVAAVASNIKSLNVAVTPEYPMLELLVQSILRSGINSSAMQGGSSLHGDFLFGIDDDRMDDIDYEIIL